MKRILIPLLLLMTFVILNGETWIHSSDPAQNQGDWRADLYYYYDHLDYGLTNPEIGSPFYQIEDSHLNAINQGAESDFNPEDGWCLYAANFGEGAIDGGFPMFALYNKFTGLMRVFIFKTQNAAANYTYMALEATYNGNSSIFSLGEESSTGNCKALDKREQLGDCSFVSITDFATSYNTWYYIDFNLLYDDIARVNDPSIYLKFYGTDVNNIDLTVDLHGQIGSQNVSNNQGIIALGNTLQSHYKDGEKLGSQVEGWLNDEYDTIDQDQTLTPTDEIIKFLSQDIDIASIIAGGNVLYGLYDFISGGGGGSDVSTSMSLSGTIDGTMEQINNLTTTDIFESIESRTLNTLYSEGLGVANLEVTPQLDHAKIMYGSTIAAHTYRVSSEDTNLLINPNCGLKEVPKKMEVALEFEFTRANNHMSWIEEATGYTYDEIIELGSYTKISETGVNNGMRYKYRTAFVPMEDMQNLAFTTPFGASNVTLKVSSVLEREEPGKDDIFFANDYQADTNNVNDVDNIYTHIPQQQVVTLFNDDIISDQAITYSKMMNITSNSTIQYNNCVINFGHDGGDGFNVVDGKLIFSNCILNLGSYGSLKSYGEGNDIELINGSTLYANHSKISICDQSILTLDNTEAVICDADIELSGSGKIEIINNSDISTNDGSRIVGSTPGYYYVDVPDGNTQGGNEVYVPGDRIVVNNSKLNLSEDTIVSCSVADSNWDGIYFTDCLATDFWTCSQLSGEISGISNIKLSNSMVKAYRANIYGISSLDVRNDSSFEIKESNYHDNNYGLYIDDSYLHSLDTDIHENGGNGITFLNSSYLSTLQRTKIYDNNVAGIDARNCKIRVYECDIYNNDSFGFLNYSSTSSSFKGYNSIRNNEYSEVIAFADAFPSFEVYEEIEGAPEVYDNIIDESIVFDKYLLMGLAYNNVPIDLYDLVISTNNAVRFFPNVNAFIFNDPSSMSANALYNEGLECIEMEDYSTAYVIFKQIIDLYPETSAAKKAVAILPYVVKAMKGDLKDLLVYLESINVVDLEKSVKEAKAFVNMTESDYAIAIALYEEIIQDPPSEEKKLLAELDQAYCYYQLQNTDGAREAVISHRKPKTIYELNDIKSEIYSRLLGEEDHAEQVPSSTILCNNYPNPFNPTTIISFSIPEDSNVNLTVYNVRGQKVKVISNERYSKGKNSVTWNGDDEDGNMVGSGVYFYKLDVNGKAQATKKCLLLK